MIALRTSAVKSAALLVVVVLILGALILVPIPQAHAVSCQWNGIGSWTDASHWSSCVSGLPDSSHSAEIVSGTVTVTGTQSLLAIHVDSGATLTCNSCILTTGASGGGITIDAGGMFNNNGGTITVPDDELTNSGTFSNSGTFTLPSGAGDILNQASGVIINGQGATISAGLDISNQGTITNCGGTITAAHTISGNPIIQGGEACAIIPEYPLGLPLLAIFMVVAYGLIRRRTATKELA